MTGVDVSVEGARLIMSGEELARQRQEGCNATNPRAIQVSLTGSFSSAADDYLIRAGK